MRPLSKRPIGSMGVRIAAGPYDARYHMGENPSTLRLRDLAADQIGATPRHPGQRLPRSGPPLVGRQGFP